MNVKDINSNTAEFADHAKLLLIGVNETIGKVRERKLTLIDAVRYSWVLSPKKAEQAEYILAVADGLIRGVYVAEKPWLPATKENFPDIPDDHGNWDRQKKRYGFRGHAAPNDIWNLYVGKRVPDEWRNYGNPIRKVHF
jgi:hypothetical protein